MSHAVVAAVIAATARTPRTIFAFGFFRSAGAGAREGTGTGRAALVGSGVVSARGIGSDGFSEGFRVITAVLMGLSDAVYATLDSS
jgi:hypothetical protein